MDKRISKLVRLGISQEEAELLFLAGLTKPAQIRKATAKELKAMGVKDAKKKVTR